MPLRQSFRLVLLLVTTLLISSVASKGYSGFDCGQGSALLLLASHKCPSDVHQQYLRCFKSLALRVSRCSIKAWPHPHQGRKHGCGSLQLVANVTDVNQAHGTMHLHASTKLAPHAERVVPVHLEYSRPDEAMHVRLRPHGAAKDECVLVFDAESASDASLHPIPGEDTRSAASLLAVLVPAILVPCVVVGLVVALSSFSHARGRLYWQPDGAEGDGYTLLDAGPSPAAGQPLAEGAVSSCGSSRTAMGLGILKAMSRRARAKRMRRSCRPTYVGLPEQSAQQHRAYVAGRLQPGPFHLVAPFFKFPPVAMPTPLEAIPESVTPTCSSASRASSSQDLSAASGDLGRGSPVLDVDEMLLLQPDGQTEPISSASSGRVLQTPSVDTLGASSSGWGWIAQPVSGDAEEGGAAAGS